MSRNVDCRYTIWAQFAEPHGVPRIRLLRVPLAQNAFQYALGNNSGELRGEQTNALRRSGDRRVHAHRGIRCGGTLPRLWREECARWWNVLERQRMSRRSSRFGWSTTRSQQPWRRTRTSTAFCNFPSARPAVSFIAVDSPAFRKRPLATYRGPRRNVSAPMAEPIVYRVCVFGLTVTESRVQRVRGDRRTCRRHRRGSVPDRTRGAQPISSSGRVRHPASTENRLAGACMKGVACAGGVVAPAIIASSFAAQQRENASAALARRVATARSD